MGGTFGSVLEGYRVVDLTWVWAGPTVTAYLADLGAEVIKIESRKKLDYNRLRSIYHKRGTAEVRDEDREVLETVSMFHNVNRNKLSATLNIQSPTGRELLRRLVKKSHILVENFSPHVLRKLGLDYESLHIVKPDLIMLSMTGGGQYGPLRDLDAYGPTITALAGLEALVGYEGERPIGMLSIGFSDPSSAVHATAALLAAVYHRERTGEGQYIDLSELESMIGLLAEPIMEYLMNGRIMQPRGNSHPFLVPHGIYPCEGQDCWLAIAVGSEEEWLGLCAALGNPAWTRDSAFADSNLRRLNRRRLDPLLLEWTMRLNAEEAAGLLQRHGVAATPVLNPEEVFTHEFFIERGLQSECVHPVTGTEQVVSVPWKMTDTPPRVRRSAPLLGEHNRYVFGELLGLTQSEITKLVAEQVIY